MFLSWSGEKRDVDVMLWKSSYQMTEREMIFLRLLLLPLAFDQPRKESVQSQPFLISRIFIASRDEP